MIYEIKKAIEALLHPGINTSFFRLMLNAIPYYISPNLDAKPPLTIYFSINSVCNLKCKMCDIGSENQEGTFYKNLGIDKERHEIDIDVFKSVIDEVAFAKPFISFTSTEPLLYKHIGEAVAYCSAKGLETALTTGGYSLPAKAEELAKAGLKRLNVSIDGPPDVHNIIRGRSDSFQKSVEGIHKFKKAAEQVGLDTEIHVSCVVSGMNSGNLKALYESLADVPIDKLNVAHMWFISDGIADEQNRLFADRYPVSVSCYNEEVRPDNINIDELYEQLTYLYTKENVDFFPKFDKEGLRKYYKTEDFLEKNSKCLASWFFIQILADGRVMPFTRCHNDSFGNINTEKFMDIWNGKKIKEWRKFIKKEKRMPMCKRCDLVN